MKRHLVFASVTKKIRDIYNKLGFNKNLKDSMFKAQEIAVTAAPNLLKRNKEVNKSNIPTVNIADKTVIEPTQDVKMDTNASVEIYDDTHNIKESDKNYGLKLKIIQTYSKYLINQLN